MKPLVESDLAAFAIVVGVVILGCVIARLLEYRAWFRGVQMYVDEPPREDDRSSIVRHRRELDTRDAL
jgi:uncharacterized membrane-anchored protein YhcB (DUF1043 family)